MVEEDQFEPVQYWTTNKEVELLIIQEQLALGSIFFKCKECHQTGMIKGGTQLAEIVREESDIAAPDPCGIEFDLCTQHSGNDHEQKRSDNETR